MESSEMIKKTIPPRWSKSKILLYLICFIFALSWAMNYGITRFFWAIPFMAGLFWMGGTRPRVVILHVLLCIGVIIFNTTLEKNPLIFPIIRGWQATFLSDGYIVIYVSDGSGGFRRKEDIGCGGCWEVKKIPVVKWQTVNVVWINIWHPEFTTQVNIETDIWPISEYDYMGMWSIRNKEVLLNKPVTSSLAEKLSILMIYPLFPFLF